MNPEDLKAHLLSVLADCAVDVQGDGSHFQVQVVGACFEGLNRVKRQQHVYKALGELISSGTVHAVQIRALTPEEAGAAS